MYIRLAILILLLTSVGAALAGEPPETTPELIARGKTTYMTWCMSCHGVGGDGNGPASVALNPKPRDLRVIELEPGKHYKKGGSPKELFKTISTGLPGTLMVGYPAIPEADRWAIVQYIVTELQAPKK